MTGEMRETDEAFTAFFRAEADRLRRLAFFLTGDLDRAPDLAQDALAATYRHWKRIRGDDPGPYARRALVNICRNAKRRRFIERRNARMYREETTEIGGVEDAMRLTEALAVLSPMQRAVVVLRYYEDLTEADIARTLDRRVGTVKSDLFRALRKMRSVLEEREVS